MCYNKTMERFLDYFRPTHYDLKLEVNRTAETLQGEIKIMGQALAPTIKLHAENMKITAVTPGLQTQISDHYYENDVLSISFPKEQKVEFIVKFQAPLLRGLEGCYLSTYKFKDRECRLATTQFESHYARKAFPCVDEPAAKAKFKLTLVIPDFESGDIVLANTSVVESLDEPSRQFTFAETPPMSTYLLAWVIGPLHSVSTVNAHGVQVTSYAALNQSLTSLEFANETAAKALDYYDEKFHERYPLPKLDQVALPDFEAGAMENWGLVTYRESCLLAEPDASLDAKRSVATTITHELAHQWFGNLVTMEWWDDLWLNESFASVIEYYAADAIYPELNTWEDFFTGDCLAALRRDCLPGVQAVKQIVHHPAEIATLFDSAIVYAKGARLIMMLIRMLGEEKFDQGLRDYFDKYKYQNTVGNDLWLALQPYADFNVADFMNAWISQPGYPAIKDGRQRRFLIDGSTDQTTWPLPEIFDDMSGHYLLDLTDAEFQAKLDDFAELSLEQRLRLLIDRMLLAKTVDVPSSSLLDLLPKFIDETSAAVWNIVASIISDLKLFCPPETEPAELYKTYLHHLLAQQFDQLDLSDQLDPNALRLRSIFLGTAYYTEDEKVLCRLAELYQPDLTKINHELVDYVLLAKLYFDEAEIFPSLLRQYQTVSDPELKSTILYTLTFAKDAGHLDQLMALLNQPEVVRPQDHIFLFIYLLRQHRTRERTLNWLYQNWNYVEKLTGEKSVEDYTRHAANVIRTESEANKFYQFFDPLADNPVLERTIKVAHTEINARLKLIVADTPDVIKKLETLTKGA